MNKFKKHPIKEYLTTVLVSLIVLAGLCMLFELELMFRCEKNVNFSELNVENLAKFCTIEELERKLLKNPDDFILNIRLGVMYESLNKLDKANDHYKTALSLSNRSNFALYSYAMFCARHDLFVFASSLAEELSGNNKRTNLFKAKIYEQLALSFDKNKNYLAATKSYQIAYKYAKSIGDFKYIKEIREKYSKEFIKSADFNMEINEPEEAISNLKNSILIKKSALANYKLGLIYLQSDYYLAEKYINEAFYMNPFVVNPYVYNSLLQKLLAQSEILGSKSTYNYYSSRLSRFKKKVGEVYLYKDQLIIDNSALLVKKTFFNKTENILFFEIKNNTKDDLKNLIVKAQIFVNGKEYNIQKHIIHPSNALEAYETLQYQDMVLPDDIKFNNLSENNDIFVKYWAKRCESAPWILIKIDFPNF